MALKGKADEQLVGEGNWVDGGVVQPLCAGLRSAPLRYAGWKLGVVW